MHVPKVFQQEHTAPVRVDHHIDVPVPMTREEVMHVLKIMHQERIVQRPRPQLIEISVGVPKITFEEKATKVPRVQDVVLHSCVFNQIQSMEVHLREIYVDQVQYGD